MGVDFIFVLIDHYSTSGRSNQTERKPNTRMTYKNKTKQNRQFPLMVFVGQNRRLFSLQHNLIL